jgi:hypothetical protein
MLSTQRYASLDHAHTLIAVAYNSYYGCDQQDEEADIYFQPVIKLTQKVEVRTLEEDEVERLQACV